MSRRSGSLAAVPTLALATLILFAAVVRGGGFSPWTPAVNLEQIPGTSPDLNTAALEGCPIVSPDGRALYFASNRAGGLGGLDIWVSRRDSRDDPWGSPENLGRPVNSSADDFCPSPMRGHQFFFVSRRSHPDACGGADIYVTRPHPVFGWLEPQNVGCQVNSAADEASPYYLEDETGRATLFFSSNRGGSSDIYSSVVQPDGSYGAAEPVPGLNTAFEDARPNLRRDGLEIVFDSNRPGTNGGPDIYVSVRPTTDDAWSEPVNLGADVNTDMSETRASLSWDGRSLYFGSNRPGGEGSTDIYLSTREKVRGPE